MEHNHTNEDRAYALAALAGDGFELNGKRHTLGTAAALGRHFGLHAEAKAILEEMAGERVRLLELAVVAFDTILFPNDERSGEGKAHMRQQLVQDMADIMESRGWAGTVPENIKHIEEAVRRSATPQYVLVPRDVAENALKLCDMHTNLARIACKVDVTTLVTDTKTALADALGGKKEEV